MRNSNPIFSSTRSHRNGTEERTSIQAPPGASDELRYLLAGITNHADYHAIVNAHHAVTEGVQDHTISQAAVLFAAVLRSERRNRQEEPVNTGLPFHKAEELLTEVRKARSDMGTAAEQMKACVETVKLRDLDDMMRHIFIIIWVLSLLGALWIGIHHVQ